MIKVTETAGTTTLDLDALFQQYLQNQMQIQDSGLGFADTGDVTPYEAAPAQPVEPRLAWTETLTVVQFLNPKCDVRSLKTPTDWPVLVASHEPVAALCMSPGSYPQLVRNLQPLLQAEKLSSLRGGHTRPLHAPGLHEWAKRVLHRQEFPQAPTALGVLRVLRQFDEANAVRIAVPTEWQAAWANEQAALTWEQGQAEKALQMWNSQPDSLPVLFNRGMAFLFLDKPEEARRRLNSVVPHLPESSGWHHLARLYVALAEIRTAR